jgi:hypothetical protein
MIGERDKPRTKGRVEYLEDLLQSTRNRHMWIHRPSTALAEPMEQKPSTYTGLRVEQYHHPPIIHGEAVS